MAKTSATGGIYYVHSIILEVGKNSHPTIVSCKIANAGKYDMIILFGWWHQEH